MKNVLIISPHFYPNDFKCNDVAFELVRKGLTRLYGKYRGNVWTFKVGENKKISASV